MPPAPDADVRVVGSGPGGATTACVLAEAGRRVLVLEEGPPPGAHVPFSRDEMLRLYRNGGLSVTLGTKVAYAQGRCVGGGSEVNGGLYHRAPDEVLAAWARSHGLRDAGAEALRPHFEAVERDLSVGRHGAPCPASLKLRDGAARLGWEAVEVARWFAPEVPGGPPVRRSMSNTLLPRVTAAGGEVRPHVRAARLRRERGGWAVDVVEAGAARTLRARTLVVACGAVQTPLLLRRSGLGRRAGDGLRLQVMAKVVARFPGEVTSEASGIPVHQVKQFAPRISLGCSVGTPPHAALALIEHPDELARLPERWRRLAVYYVQVKGGAGRVRSAPGFDDPVVTYALDADDRAALGEGLRHLCRALLAAGAEALFPAARGLAPLTREADLGALPAAFPADRATLVSVHPSSSCPMGEADGCTVDSWGRLHGEEGLFVADGSILCDSPGVNPQGTIMAFARRNAARLAAGSS